MVEISDRLTADAWLRGRMPEDAVVIALRAALRVIPFLQGAQMRNASDPMEVIVLPCLRASNAAWVAVTFSDSHESLRETALAALESSAFPAAEINNSKHDADLIMAAIKNATLAGYRPTEVTESDQYPLEAIGLSGEVLHSAASLSDKFYSAVNEDAKALELGMTTRELAKSPLFPEFLTPWFAEGIWPNARAWLETQGPDWQVWTRWYEDRLHGRPVNEALELARVLEVTEEEWRAGPKVANAKIAEIEARFNWEWGPDEPDEGGPDADLARRLEAALQSGDLRAALADFSHDDLANLMRMIPFVEDVKRLDDPALLRDRANRLSELADGMRDLADGIGKAERNVPAALVDTLTNYAGEASREVERVRPGRLWDLGLLLRAARLDDDIVMALDTILAESLERMVDKHLDLMRDYYAATLARMRGADDIEPAPDATPEEVVEALAEAADALETADWGDAPPPDEEIPAVLHDRVDELREILDRIGRTSDRARLDRLMETFWRKASVTAATVIRYTARFAQLGYKYWKEVGAAGGSYAFLRELFPETVAAAIEAIARLFSMIIPFGA